MTDLWMEACLSFRSYIPKKLEVGMLFLRTTSDGKPYVFKLERTPINQDEFIKEVGWPVEPYIVDIGDPRKDEQEIVVAEPHQIAWWDDGDDDSPDLFDVEVDQFNNILENYDGWLDIMMEEDEDGDTIPYLLKGKIVIRYVVDEEDDNIDDQQEWHPDTII